MSTSKTESEAVPQSVDELTAWLADLGQHHLEQLGFEGQVVVNVCWTDNPDHGWLAYGSLIPDDAPALLADSLRASAEEVES